MQLNPCPFCGCQDVKVLSCLADNKCRALFCTACGARGPVRYKADYMSEDRVQFLASHDWNSRFGPSIEGTIESTKEPLSDEEIRDLVSTAFDLGNGFSSEKEARLLEEAAFDREPVFGALLKSCGFKESIPGAAAVTCTTAKRPHVDQPVDGDQDPKAGTRATAESLSPVPPAPPAIPSSSPPPFGELDSLPAIRQRLQAFFDRTGAGLYTVDLGITPQNIKLILSGKTKKLRPESVAKITAALDELENPGDRAEPRSYRDRFIHRSRPHDPEPISGPDGVVSPVLRLPNKFAPITGINPIPDLTPPARCSKVP